MVVEGGGVQEETRRRRKSELAYEQDALEAFGVVFEILKSRLELEITVDAGLGVLAHGASGHVNDDGILAYEQIAQESEQTRLMLFPHLHIYVVQADDGRDDVDAGVFVVDVVVVLVGELAYHGYERINEAGLVVSFHLFELVEQVGVEVFGSFELGSVVLGLEAVEEELVVGALLVSCSLLVAAAATWPP